MKQIINIFLVGVLMATLMSALLGCSSVDDKATNAILNGLTDKYGKSFTVYALGDRIGKDTATAYVYANDDPTLLFKVKVNTKGEIVFENYAYRYVCRSVESIVNASFEKAGIDSECFVDFSLFNNDVEIGISVLDYIKESSSDGILITAIVKSSEILTAETIEKVYTDIYGQLPSIRLGTGLYVLGSDDYDSIAENIERETQLINWDRLRVHGAKGDIIELDIKMSNDGLSLSADEINVKLSKEVD